MISYKFYGYSDEILWKFEENFLINSRKIMEVMTKRKFKMGPDYTEILENFSENTVKIKRKQYEEILQKLWKM